MRRGGRRQRSLYKVRLKHLLSAQRDFVLGGANGGGPSFPLKSDSAAFFTRDVDLDLGTLRKRGRRTYECRRTPRKQLSPDERFLFLY